MQIKEIRNRPEIFATFKVLIQIYNTLQEETYIDEILNLMQRGYKMAAVFDENECCLGVIGIGVIHKLHCGKMLEIEDFMVDRDKRGIGVGKMLMRWAEWQATNYGCRNIISTLETKRMESQKIFSREKFALDGFCFIKSC